MQNPTPELLWIDMETTGLDAEEDAPIELGFMLTDTAGHRIDSWRSLVWESNYYYQRAITQGQRNEFVGPMHEKSGLWMALMSLQRKLTRVQAEVEVVDWLKSHGIEAGTMPIIGNSIGSLDRPFLQHHFPNLNEFLHYRNIDISSLKELCRRWNAPLFAQYKKEFDSKGDATHRVMDDIEASILEYELYVKHFLVTDEDKS